MRAFQPAKTILALLTLVYSLSASADSKPDGLELEVFQDGKPVGTEMVRTTKLSNTTIYSTEARVQTKDKKNVTKAFRQRGVVEVLPSGELNSYDRWIDYGGATQQLKLFKFKGEWRISLMEQASGGHKPKPKITELSGKTIQVVLDARLPSYVAVAVERIGDAQTVDYVRVDDGTTGRLTVTRESLTDGQGGQYTRTKLDNDSLHLHVLKDGKGRLLAIQGIDTWHAVVKDAKVPKGLKKADGDK